MKTFLHRLQVFKHFLPSCWLCLWRSGRCGLTGGSALLGAGFESIEPLLLPVCLALFPVFTPVACLHGLVPSRTVSPNKISLLQVTLVMVLYHRNRKVTNPLKKCGWRQDYCSGFLWQCHIRGKGCVTTVFILFHSWIYWEERGAASTHVKEKQ